MRMQYASGRLILFGLTPQTAEVFNMVHVSGLFTIVETEEEAKKLIKQPAS
jgi:anti-anti-sigma regulatory factor